MAYHASKFRLGRCRLPHDQQRCKCMSTIRESLIDNIDYKNTSAWHSRPTLLPCGQRPFDKIRRLQRDLSATRRHRRVRSLHAGGNGSVGGGIHLSTRQAQLQPTNNQHHFSRTTHYPSRSRAILLPCFAREQEGYNLPSDHVDRLGLIRNN
jgi:hypothetical protein